MTTFSILAQQLHHDLRPLMRAADIPPHIQQALLARLTLFLLFTAQHVPLTLSVRVPHPLEGAELTLYFANGEQLTLLTRHTRVRASTTDKLYDTMITLRQRGQQLMQKACYSWEIGRVVHSCWSQSS